MIKKNTVVIILSCLPCFLSAQIYQVPPTFSSSSYGQTISDEKMEECIVLYNEAKWLVNQLDSIKVNTSIEEDVNSYNLQVEKHRRMTLKFNDECAGKQSLSACKAAQKLNAQNGLKVQSCE